MMFCYYYPIGVVVAVVVQVVLVDVVVFAAADAVAATDVAVVEVVVPGNRSVVRSFQISLTMKMDS